MYTTFSKRLSSALTSVLVVLLIILIAASGFGAVSLNHAHAATTAKLWITPASRQVAVGDTFTVQAMLDTVGNAIDGVDLRYLRYGSSLEVQDADTSKSGVQIKAGTLMSNTTRNVVDTSARTIDFSQITTGGTTFTGSGVLAEVTFKVVTSDSPGLNFDFAPGVTTDTNVASGGNDVLLSATGAQYVNSGGSGAPPPPSSGAGGGVNGGTEDGPVVIIGGAPGQEATTPPTTQPGGMVCTTPNFTGTFTVGSRDNQVKVLQRFLNKNGFQIAATGAGSPGNETDYYGGLTKSAVVRFQEAYTADILAPFNRTTGTGFFGQSTRAKLNALVAANGYQDCEAAATFAGTFARSLTLGNRGEDVRRLQQYLNQKGFTISTTGGGSPGNETDYFGAKTKAAVIKLQNAYKDAILTPAGLSQGTGYFGPSTIKYVNSTL